MALGRTDAHTAVDDDEIEVFGDGLGMGNLSCSLVFARAWVRREGVDDDDNKAVRALDNERCMRISF